MQKEYTLDFEDSTLEAVNKMFAVDLSRSEASVLLKTHSALVSDDFFKSGVITAAILWDVERYKPLYNFPLGVLDFCLGTVMNYLHRVDEDESFGRYVDVMKQQMLKALFRKRADANMDVMSSPELSLLYTIGIAMFENMNYVGSYNRIKFSKTFLDKLDYSISLDENIPGGYFMFTIMGIQYTPEFSKNILEAQRLVFSDPSIQIMVEVTSVCVN